MIALSTQQIIDANESFFFFNPFLKACSSLKDHTNFQLRFCLSMYNVFVATSC